MSDANAVASLAGLAAAVPVSNTADPAHTASVAAAADNSRTSMESTGPATRDLLTAQAGPSPETADGTSPAPELAARMRKAERYCMSTRQHVLQQAAARHRSNSRLETRTGVCSDLSEGE